MLNVKPRISLFVEINKEAEATIPFHQYETLLCLPIPCIKYSQGNGGHTVKSEVGTRITVFVPANKYSVQINPGTFHDTRHVFPHAFFITDICCYYFVQKNLFSSKPAGETLVENELPYHTDPNHYQYLQTLVSIFVNKSSGMVLITKHSKSFQQYWMKPARKNPVRNNQDYIRQYMEQP